MKKHYQNHYHWLERHLQEVFNVLNVDCNNAIIRAHGDKCYGYRDIWEKEGIPFPHGVAIYLLSYIHPWSETCRDTRNGFKKPCDWVIETYKQVREVLPPV